MHALRSGWEKRHVTWNDRAVARITIMSGCLIWNLHNFCRETKKQTWVPSQGAPMKADPSPVPWKSIRSSGAACARLFTDIHRPYRSGETPAENPESSSAWWDGGGSDRRASCPFPAKSCASHRAACMLKEEAIINFAELVSERLVLFWGAWAVWAPEGSAGRCLSEENTVFLCPEPRAARHPSPFLENRP